MLTQAAWITGTYGWRKNDTPAIVQMRATKEETSEFLYQGVWPAVGTRRSAWSDAGACLAMPAQLPSQDIGGIRNWLH